MYGQNFKSLKYVLIHPERDGYKSDIYEDNDDDEGNTIISKQK